MTRHRPRNGMPPAARPGTTGARRLRPDLRRINETRRAMPGQTRIASAVAGNFA